MKMKVTDLQFLKEIGSKNPGFLKEVINDILSSSEKYIRDMELMLKANEWKELAKVAHKYRSSAAIIRATTLQETLRDIEMNSLAENPNGLFSLFELAKNLTIDFKTELNEELEKL